jgi:hypothetical protein
MGVTILEAIPRTSSGMTVQFSTPYGDAEGRWASEAPVAQHTYDVELTIGDRVEWNRTGAVVAAGVPSIMQTPDGIRLHGTLLYLALYCAPFPVHFSRIVPTDLVPIHIRRGS